MSLAGGTSDAAPSRTLAVGSDTAADRAQGVAYGAAVGSIGIIPIVGPVLAGIAGSFIPNAKLDRATRFLNELAEELRVVEGRIDEEFVHRDEFAGAVEDVLDRIVRRKNNAKLKYFAAALAACTTETRPTAGDRDRFLDLLDELRPSHLAVLAGIARGTPEIASEYPFTVGAAAYRALSAATAGSGSEDVSQDIRDLEVRGLLHAMDEGTTMLHVARDVRALVTPLGRRFIEFASIAEPITPKSSTRRRPRRAKPAPAQ